MFSRIYQFFFFSGGIEVLEDIMANDKISSGWWT